MHASLKIGGLTAGLPSAVLSRLHSYLSRSYVRMAVWIDLTVQRPTGFSHRSHSLHSVGYVVEVFDIIALYGLACHSYADDSVPAIVQWVHSSTSLARRSHALFEPVLQWFHRHTATRLVNYVCISWKTTFEKLKFTSATSIYILIIMCCVLMKA